jgi:hypothetical protein
MNPNIESDPGEPTLSELIELVASVLPEDQVADTVAALFDRGVVSFARLPSRDERAALERDS